MLTETIAVSALATQLRVALAPWRKDLAVHDPAKMLLDLALTVARGGEYLSDVGDACESARAHERAAAYASSVNGHRRRRSHRVRDRATIPRALWMTTRSSPSLAFLECLNG